MFAKHALNLKSDALKISLKLSLENTFLRAKKELIS